MRRIIKEAAKLIGRQLRVQVFRPRHASSYIAGRDYGYIRDMIRRD
jgi:hypothetical protein